MKSKVIAFLLSILLWNSLCLSFVNSSPTFGDEFVHIKVHLPKENAVSGPPHPIGHHGPPKVVHHYHHKRRRPSKKSPFGKHTGLLESILLSEVKAPISSDHYKYLSHAEDIAKHVDTFVVKPEKPKTHVDTYTVLEESKPKETVETYKVIESKVPPKHHYHHQQHDLYDDEGHHYKHKAEPEPYEVIDNLFDDFRSHVKHHEHDYGYLSPKKQRVKTVKIVDSHDHSNYGYDEHEHEHEHDHDHHHGNGLSDGYHYATKSHSDTVKIVDNHTPHQHSHEYSVNFDKRPHSETVEIVKTHSHAKPNSYYRRKPYKSHSSHYHLEQPNPQDGSYDYRPHQHQESYSPPEDTYLPPNHHQQEDYQSHNHYAGGVHPNSVYDDEAAPAGGAVVADPNDSYLPPPLPTFAAHPETTDDNGHWPGYDSTYKATETYTGIDSYSAAHVQGFGSGGYKYPSPYA